MNSRARDRRFRRGCTRLSATVCLRPNEKVRRYWDALAGVYDDNALIAGPTYPYISRRLLADVRRQDEVLEVAAGTGLLTVHLVHRARRVVCTDFSPRMVRIAKQKLSAFPNAETALADAADLPFRSISFDVIVCSHALHVMAAPEIAVREFRRVLRPGGRLIAITFLDGEMNLAMVARSAFTFLPRFGWPPCRRTLRLEGFADLVGSSGLQVEEALIVARKPIPTGYVIARKPGVRPPAVE